MAFGKNDIFAIRREIESSTPYKCCIVYGNLPPETRAAQAKLFNDMSSGYDILVASDAIGMGLNLNIRRVIFHTIYKSNGERIARLSHSAFKQIGGRAGRRSSPWAYGEVTCRRAEDMKYLRTNLSREIPQLTKAGLLPSVEHIEHFASALNGGTVDNDNGSGTERRSILDMKEVVDRFGALAKVEGNYFMCRREAMAKVAEELEGKNLSLADKFTFCVAPANTNDSNAMKLIKQFSEKRSQDKMYSLNLTIPTLPPKTFDELGELCNKHNLIDLYLWLTQRFEKPSASIDIRIALAQKKVLLDMITKALKEEEEKINFKHSYDWSDSRFRSKFWQEQHRSNTSDWDLGLRRKHGNGGRKGKSRGSSRGSSRSSSRSSGRSGGRSGSRSSSRGGTNKQQKIRRLINP